MLYWFLTTKVITDVDTFWILKQVFINDLLIFDYKSYYRCRHILDFKTATYKGVVYSRSSVRWSPFFFSAERNTTYCLSETKLRWEEIWTTANSGFGLLIFDRKTSSDSELGQRVINSWLDSLPGSAPNSFNFVCCPAQGQSLFPIFGRACARSGHFEPG